MDQELKTQRDKSAYRNKLTEEEAEPVKEHKAGHLKGERKAPVLFEEADGVWLDLQGEDRERRGFPKAELKLSIAYDGWKKEGKERYSLDGKVVTAGFIKAKEFHKIREAQIAKEYDPEETEVRIMNGGGAPWIKKVPDKKHTLPVGRISYEQGHKGKHQPCKSRKGTLRTA